MRKRRPTVPPKKKTKPQGEWYATRQILDFSEKEDKYLIEWEDNPETGQPYAPTWEPRNNITSDLIEDWEKQHPRKKQKITLHLPAKSPINREISQRRSITPSSSSSAQTNEQVSTSSKGFSRIDLDEVPPQLASDAILHDDHDHAEIDDSQLPVIVSQPGPGGVRVQISPKSTVDPNTYIQLDSSTPVNVQSSSQAQQVLESEQEAVLFIEKGAEHSGYLGGVVPDSQPFPASLRSDSLASECASSHLETQVSSGQNLIKAQIPLRDISVSAKRSIRAESVGIQELARVFHGPRSKSYSPTSQPVNGSLKSQLPKTFSSLETSVPRLGQPLVDLQDSGNSRVEHHPSVTEAKQESGEDRLEPSSFPFQPFHESIVSSVGSRDHNEDSKVVEILDSPAEDLADQGPSAFQTQVPLVSESQSTIDTQAFTRSAADSDADEVLPDGQAISRRLNSTSQIFLETLEERSPRPAVRQSRLEALFNSHLVESPEISPTTVLGPKNISDSQPHDDRRESESTLTDVEFAQRDSIPSVQWIQDKAFASIEVVESSLQNFSSSEIPEAPSHLPDTFDSKAPPRPATPSDILKSDLTAPLSPASKARVSVAPDSDRTLHAQSSALQLRRPSVANARPSQRQGSRILSRPPLSRMSSLSSSVGKPLPANRPERSPLKMQERLQLAREAKRRESLKAAEDLARRSPSVVPEPTSFEEAGNSRLTAQEIEVPLPLRAVDPELHTPTRPSNLHIHREISRRSSAPQATHEPVVEFLPPPNLGQAVYMISIPFSATNKNYYKDIVNHNRSIVEAFIQSDFPDQALVQDIEAYLDRLRKATVHVDLAHENTQSDVPPEDAMKWLTQQSKKFKFLKALLEELLHHDYHIGIVGKGVPFLDIVETVLKGMHISYERPDTLTRSDPADANEKLRVSLIATGEEGSSVLPKPADLILAFDGSFNAMDRQMLSLRDNVLHVGQPAPVIWLTVFSSVEHIDMCLPSSLKGVARLRTILTCIIQSRSQVGDLFAEEPEPTNAALKVADFLQAGGQPYNWLVQGVRPVETKRAIISSQETDSSTQSEFTSEGQGAHTINELDIDDSSNGKKQRMTPVPDTTHISESVPSSEAANQTINELRQSLEKISVELAAQQSNHAKELASLKAKLAASEQQLHNVSEALGDLQHRYESQREAKNVLRGEKGEITNAAAAMVRQLEAKTIEFAVQQEALIHSRTETQELRVRLLSHEVPAVAEYEVVQADAKRLSMENSALERKVEIQAKDLEYARGMYQQASTAAAEFPNEIEELQAQLVTAQQRASGEAVRLKKMNYKSELDRHVARIEELESLLVDREEKLQQNNEKARGRGVTTRGGSVQPKSPRQGNGGGSRTGSRPASPMPPGGYLGVSGREGLGMAFANGGAMMARTGSGLRPQPQLGTFVHGAVTARDRDS